MPSSQFTYALPFGAPRPVVREEQVEYGFIGKLQSLKYDYRTDIRDRAALERNFREKFEALNRVHLSDGEFARLLDEIVTPDVFAAARTLRSINAFTRDDGTPLNYTLVNIKDWCKNTFEVVNQLRINTDYSHHRYDVLILINGVPCVQIELKTLGISPRRAMEQIVDYKNDLGNGYSKTLLCFLQLFIVSNRTETHYFANNNARHFAFNADERFLPIYQFADEANKKITHLDHFAETFLPKCALGELSEFDLYYQDVQKRIKDQQWPNADFPAAKKIDITIVVDMLLTGFDSKYLNTLYVTRTSSTTGSFRPSRAPTACSTAASPTATSSTSASSKTTWTPPSPCSRAKTPPSKTAKSGWWTKRPWSSTSSMPPCKSWPTSCRPRAWPAHPRPCPSSRATTPAPPSSRLSRKCSA
jgi:type I site-specific restriction-modification system R (restriction) subunit